MFILVTGPESSGTRWVSQICAGALNIHGHDTWNGHDRINDTMHGVLHRSLPHGSRNGFLDMRKIVDGEAARFGGIGRIIVCIRDQTCVYQSSKYAHNKRNTAMTRKNMSKAADICKSLLDDPRTMLFSYETAMYLKDRYVQTLFTWLGIPKKLELHTLTAIANTLMISRM